VPCRKSKVKCSGSTPCERCIEREITLICVPHQRIHQNTVSSSASDSKSFPAHTLQGVPLVQALPSPQAAPGPGGSAPCVGPHLSPQVPQLASIVATVATAVPIASSTYHGRHVGSLVYSNLNYNQMLPLSAATPPPPPPLPPSSISTQQQQHFLPLQQSSHDFTQQAWSYSPSFSTNYASNHMNQQKVYPISSSGSHPMVHMPTSATAAPMPVMQAHTQGFAHCQPQPQLQALVMQTPATSLPTHTGTVTPTTLYPVQSHRDMHHRENTPSMMLLSKLCDDCLMPDSLPSPAQCHHTVVSNNTPRDIPMSLSPLGDSTSVMTVTPTPCAEHIRIAEAPPALVVPAVPVPTPQSKIKKCPECPTFMLRHAPTIRRRVAHLQMAAQLIYDACASPSTSLKKHRSIDAFRSFNERMSAVFDDLLTRPPTHTAPAQQRHSGTLTDARRSGFEQYLLGVVYMAVQKSKYELALAHKAHEAMMRRVQGAAGVLELRKAALNNFPICVFAKATYPDWTTSGMWLNKQAMEVFAIDPNDCPNQVLPMKSFMKILAHPVTHDAATSHVAFSIAHNRPNSCHYRVWKRTDGKYLAGLFSNHYLLGPPPSHRLYFAYLFFQPLPVQPLDMDQWSRDAMLRTNETQSGRTSSSAASAKYPGIMHQLTQDHIRVHPEDEMSLPPLPSYKNSNSPRV
jgi:Fungal Zn(2)-Cys(6) binuclear cluster domain